MEKPPISLSQTITYLKHCSSQLMTNRAISPASLSVQRIHEIASIEYLELDRASKQVTSIQKDLFRAIHALDGDDKAAVREALLDIIYQLNSEILVPASKDENKVDKLACDPALAG
ncbi:hypothetical protein [Photobacterium sp. OFAV2-7]|uniref:hypothetical protein n=1 Tax=Photobacterium sp. OFAV2-7 TaxID=2917748 RepID=UPI001EF64925|nr:hypothetical protein [Photobacterium sp. OFAV2-7]MCG7588387.1 hypothetical protein [Photobacterium sp. OFAV2-7]